VPKHFALENRVTITDAAKYLGVAMQTMNRWRSTGAGPKFYRSGGRTGIFYLVEDLDAFIESRAGRAAS
jgi:predicted site-specific integrase-resolvase